MLVLYGVTIVKCLVTLQGFATTRESVSFVLVSMKVMKGVFGKFAVQIAVAVILLSVLRVQHISPGMKCLQNNIQSINTSLSLLRHTMQRLQIDVALLQEVWHPLSDTINIRNYCLLYTSPSPRDGLLSRMPSSA